MKRPIKIDEGKYWKYNFTRTGSPIVSGEIASNFSASNYLVLSKQIPSCSKVEIQIHIKTPNSLTGYSSSYPAYAFGINAEDFYGVQAFIASTHHSGNTSGYPIWSIDATYKSGPGWTNNLYANNGPEVKVNTEYLIKIVWVEKIYSLYVKEIGVDDDFTLILSSSSQSGFDFNRTLWLGTTGGWSKNCYFSGQIYLKDTFIKTDDKFLWKAMEETDQFNYDYLETSFKKEEKQNQTMSVIVPNNFDIFIKNKSMQYLSQKDEQVHYKTNITKIGSIKVNEGIATGFNTANTIAVPQVFVPEDKSWEFVIKFKNNSSSYSYLVPVIGRRADDDRVNGLVVYLETNPRQCRWYLNSNASSWNIFEARKITYDKLPIGKPYYMKWTFDGTNRYTFEYSEDNKNYFILDSYISTEKIKQTQVWEFFGQRSGNVSVLNGEFYLEDSYIKIDNEIWWQGSKQVDENEAEYSKGNIKTIISGEGLPYFKNNKRFNLINE